MTTTLAPPAVNFAPKVTKVGPTGASDILNVLGHATFVWDIVGDTLQWSDNVASVLPEIPAEALARASDFSKLIEPSRGVRSDAVLNSTGSDAGQGVPYQIEYGIRASMSAPVLWIEEAGCWFAGADGRPARALGLVRVNNERRARD